MFKKEDLAGTKKKGRTWGPSSTHQKERVGGEERYKKHDGMDFGQPLDQLMIIDLLT